MFSHRVPDDLSSNRLSAAIARVQREGRPILDLTLSNPTRAGFDYPPDLLEPLASQAALVYEPHPFGMSGARNAVAAEYGRRGAGVPVDRIVLTASTSEAYSVLFKLLCDPEDDVLVPRPSYPLFDHLTRLDAVMNRPYDLEYDGRGWSIDFDSLERAMTPRSRAVLVVHPNNPTGSFLKRQELERLAQLCAARSMAIISDEVFADYGIAPSPDACGSVVERRDVLAFGLGGLSKSVGLPQAKLGWIGVAGPDDLVDKAIGRLEVICDAYLSVSTAVQVAAADLLRRGASVRAQIQGRIRDNYRRLTALTLAAPSCRVLHAEGGWYAVLRVPALGREEDLVLELLERDGVLTHPGYFFDFPREAFLVVSLIVPEETFTPGTSRLIRHFDCTAAVP
jgi:aspartate/methionine/tyrosine aminotransferase